MLVKKGFKHSFTNKYSTACPKSSNPFYRVSYYKNGLLLLGQTVQKCTVCPRNLVYFYSKKGLNTFM